MRLFIYYVPAYDCPLFNNHLVEDAFIPLFFIFFGSYEVFRYLVSSEIRYISGYDVNWVLYRMQPLFPGESGVDQLVEIIKVYYLLSYCLHSFTTIIDVLRPLNDFLLHFLLYCNRFWGLRLEKKSSAWILITMSTNSLRSKLTRGTRFARNFIVISSSLIGTVLFVMVEILWGYNFQIFHKRMPPEAVDLVSRLLQYSPSLRCTAVRKLFALLFFLNFIKCFFSPFVLMMVQ